MLRQQPILVQQNSSDWRMNMRGLANKEFHLETMDDDNKVFYSPKTLCLTSQTKIYTGENKPYALSNIHDEHSMDGEFNFASHSDAFGTDNCTTHHI